LLLSFSRSQGKPEARIFEGIVADTPLLFTDKQIMDITIKDVYMTGPGALLYTKCEVYPNQGIATDVCFLDFTLSCHSCVGF
jgi:hypothetical protein